MSNADFILSFIIHLIGKYITIPEAAMIKNEITISCKLTARSAWKITEFVEMKNRRIMFSG